MTKTTQNPAHLTDGELVRYLDHEVEEAERRELMRHLSSCDACAERLQTLSDKSREVGRRIAALDADARADELTRARALAAARNARRAHRPAGMQPARVAAVLATIALGSLTVQPVRAWLMDQWESLTDADVAAPIATAPRALDESGSRVRFTPTAEVFTLEIDHLQTTGSLTIQLGGADPATAQIVNGAGENLLVLPSGVRIENREGSQADYLVTLPANLRTVQVVAGQTAIAIIPVEGASDRWTRTIALQPVD
jgi:hypothetical protein